jgi:hypothetical protein
MFTAIGFSELRKPDLFCPNLLPNQQRDT